MKRNIVGLVLLLAVLMSLVTGIFAWEFTTLLRPISCNRFVDDDMLFDHFSELRFGNEHEWIAQFSSNTIIANETISLNGETKTWEWDTIGSSYILQASGGKYVLSQKWKYFVVTINDMLRCLGEPDLYLNAAQRGPDAYLQRVSFFYLEQGYIVSGAWFYESSPQVINDKTPLLLIDYAAPLSSTDPIDVIYGSVSPSNLNKLISEIKDWPGDISKLNQKPVIYQLNP